MDVLKINDDDDAYDFESGRLGSNPEWRSILYLP